MKQTVGAVLRKWFLAGLLVWIPLGTTLLLVSWMITLLDASLFLIPARLRPHIPGLGALLSIVLVLGTGALTANFFGRQLLAWAEGLFQRIPLVRSIYGGLKKLAETLFSGKGNSFRQVVMIEYPRAGMWSIGFVSGEAMPEANALSGQDLVTIYVPTTPNPTSGLIVLVPREQVHRDAHERGGSDGFVISLGVVAPGASATMRG